MLHDGIQTAYRLLWPAYLEIDGGRIAVCNEPFYTSMYLLAVSSDKYVI
jgi:hypothetical protein